MGTRFAQVFVPIVAGVIVGLLLIFVLLYAAVFNQNRSFIVRSYTGPRGYTGATGPTPTVQAHAYIGLTPTTLTSLFQVCQLSLSSHSFSFVRQNTFVALTPGSSQVFSSVNGAGQLGDSAGMVCTHDGEFSSLWVVANGSASSGNILLQFYTSEKDEFPNNFVATNFKVSIPADGQYHEVTTSEVLPVTQGMRWAVALTNDDPDVAATTLDALNVGFRYTMNE